MKSIIWKQCYFQNTGPENVGMAENRVSLDSMRGKNY